MGIVRYVRANLSRLVVHRFARRFDHRREPFPGLQRPISEIWVLDLGACSCP